MKKKMIFIIIIIMTIISASVFFTLKRSDAQISFQTEEVVRTNLTESISCTGVIKLKNASVVNFQTSGTVNKVYADFNQKVKKGQVLATLDTLLFELSVQSAEATLFNASNQLTLAEKNYQDTLALFAENFKSQYDVDTARINRDSALVGVKTSLVALERTKVNLRYAVIYAPIDGMIIERNVEAGQSVASSEYNNSRSTNYLVASDTKHMEIFATVDENDISRVKQGQKVAFTVEGHQEKSFSGTVSQVRLQPLTSENVVVYTVVIEAPNPNGLLVPGMTATVDIITGERKNILAVSSGALKFQPARELVEMPESMKQNGTNAPAKDQKPPELPANTAVVWIKAVNNGKLIPVMVTKGMDSGSLTEISPVKSYTGRESLLTEGLSIITGIITTGTKKPSQQSQKSILSTMGGPGGGPGPR